MKIKLTFPVNLEECCKNSNTTMIGNNYPITFNNEQIGFGNIIECNGFDLIVEPDKDVEKFYEKLTSEAQKSFEIITE